MSLTIPDRFSFVVLCWTCAFLLSWEVSLAVTLFLITTATIFPLMTPVTGAGTKYLNRFLLYAVPLVFVLIVANGLLLHEGRVLFQSSFFAFYEGGVQYALRVSLRLILLSISILLFFVSTRIRDTVDFLDGAGLPGSIVSILLLTLFFLEQLPRRISSVFTAQEARGAPVRKGIISRSRAFFVILSPLVLSSLVESVERGVALELRGYRTGRGVGHPKREHDKIRWPGYAFLVLSLIIIITEGFRWLLR